MEVILPPGILTGRIGEASESRRSSGTPITEKFSHFILDCFSAHKMNNGVGLSLGIGFLLGIAILEGASELGVIPMPEHKLSTFSAPSYSPKAEFAVIASIGSFSK